ncbi:hypothetical protein [Streptomyces sp. NPDC001843]|uniref:hypothetical protein n=1 Tax=Streptomyces sp. NPDC001843 TaxID=3364617 RepID=UPI0036B54A2F
MELLYVPFDDLTGADHGTLRVEGGVAILPPDHRLADHSEVPLAVLAHETLPRWNGVRGSEVPGIEPVAGSGPEVADGAELTHMVPMRRTIAVPPRSPARPQHPGLVHVPVADAPRSALGLAWGQEDRRRLVADFVVSAADAAHSALRTAVPSASRRGERAPSP